MPKHEVSSNVLNSTIDEVLFDLPQRSSVCWRWIIRDHLLFDEEALSRIDGAWALTTLSGRIARAFSRF